MFEELGAEVVLVGGTAFILTRLLVIGLSGIDGTMESLVNVFRSRGTVTVVDVATDEEMVLQVTLDIDM